MQIELFATTPPPPEVIRLLSMQPLNNLPIGIAKPALQHDNVGQAQEHKNSEH